MKISKKKLLNRYVRVKEEWRMEKDKKGKQLIILKEVEKYYEDWKLCGIW